MSRISILREELQLPLYETLSDDQCAQALNAPKIGLKDVPIKDLTNAMSRIGKLAPILRAVRAGTVAAVDLMDALTLAQMVGQTTILLNDATVAGILAELQTANLLNGGDLVALQAIATITTTRADELGIGGVSTGDVTEARGE